MSQNINYFPQSRQYGLVHGALGVLRLLFVCVFSGGGRLSAQFRRARSICSFVQLSCWRAPSFHDMFDRMDGDFRVSFIHVPVTIPVYWMLLGSLLLLHAFT